jgi:hypothetical protein
LPGEPDGLAPFGLAAPGGAGLVATLERTARVVAGRSAVAGTCATAVTARANPTNVDRTRKFFIGSARVSVGVRAG